MIVKRELTEKVRHLAEKFPVISISGPRQSGKTTLARSCFPDYDYANLELPDTRALAHDDPRSFLKAYKKGLILDEVQNVPEIFLTFRYLLMNPQRLESILSPDRRIFCCSEKFPRALPEGLLYLTCCHFPLKK